MIEVGLRIALLGVDEMREFGRVTDEKNGSVVKHPIHVTLVRLDCDERVSSTFAKTAGSVRLTEKPLGSRAVSGEPLSPPTVLNRTVRGHV